MIQITSHLAIGEDEVQEEFIRASGPGGQNVNKVSSAVQIRFDAAHSPSLPDDVRTRLLRLAGRHATNDGVLVLKAQTFRTRERNRDDALRRLVELIHKASIKPIIRRATQPTLASRQRRVVAKRHRSEIKRHRRMTALDYRMA